jgi:hypothetical protein
MRVCETRRHKSLCYALVHVADEDANTTFHGADPADRLRSACHGFTALNYYDASLSESVRDFNKSCSTLCAHMLLCEFNWPKQFKSRHVRTRSDGHLTVHQTECDHRFKAQRGRVLEHINRILPIQIDMRCDHTKHWCCDRRAPIRNSASSSSTVTLAKP